MSRVTLWEGGLTPYVGGLWSSLDVHVNRTLTYDVVDPVAGLGTLTSDSGGDTEAQDRAGAFVGVAYEWPNRWRVSVEGRFIDETAVTAQATYTF